MDTDIEVRRLGVLLSYELLGSSPEPQYDQITQLGAQLFEVPMCSVSIVGEHEQWFKSHYGFDACSSSRDVSFCAHTLTRDDPLIVFDTATDDRFCNNSLVTGEPNIRFYAGAPLIDDHGVHLGAFCVIDTEPRTCFDASKRQLLVQLAAIVMERIQDARRTRAAFALGGLADTTATALITATAEGRITYWNRGAEMIFGHKAEVMIGQSLNTIIPARFRDEHNAVLRRIAAGGAVKLAGKTVEVPGLRRDGSEFPAETTISCWQGLCGIEIGAQINDITERRERESRLEHLAHYEPLTGLLNRRGFTAALIACLEEQKSAALLALDLDGFKSINDNFGHGVGDTLLQAVAVRLASLIDHGGILARIGGDEFAILLPGNNDPLVSHSLADRILLAFAEPLQISGHSFNVGTSVGIALAPLHASDAEDLLLRADLALLAAKRDGGRRMRIFDSGMANQLAVRRAFEDELLYAYERNEWELFYQPQVDLDSGKIIGVEALLRWRHPKRGLILPAVFLPVLETHSVAFEVGNWVIEEACSQLARWRGEGWDVPRIGVNLFTAQFTSGNLEKVVSNALEQYALQPGDLEIEITETIALRPDDHVLAALNALRDAGVCIALDDFGTGFASLSTLKQVPVTRLKIDKSFVQDIRHSSHSAAIVSAIASIATGLNLEVIAEGIETEEQRQALIALGCNTGQGYLFGKPEPADTGKNLFQLTHAA